MKRPRSLFEVWKADELHADVVLVDTEGNETPISLVPVARSCPTFYEMLQTQLQGDDVFTPSRKIDFKYSKIVTDITAEALYDKVPEQVADIPRKVLLELKNAAQHWGLEVLHPVIIAAVNARVDKIKSTKQHGRQQTIEEAAFFAKMHGDIEEINHTLFRCMKRIGYGTWGEFNVCFTLHRQDILWVAANIIKVTKSIQDELYLVEVLTRAQLTKDDYELLPLCTIDKLFTGPLQVLAKLRLAWETVPTIGPLRVAVIDEAFKKLNDRYRKLVAAACAVKDSLSEEHDDTAQLELAVLLGVSSLEKALQ